MKHIKIVPMAAEHLNDVAALETQLRGLWQRRPWKES